MKQRKEQQQSSGSHFASQHQQKSQHQTEQILSNRSGKLGQQPQQTSHARQDSTDRAISRILDKQLSGGTQDFEDAKKENDQTMVNLKFNVDRQSLQSQHAEDEYQMPSSIHSQ